MYRVETPEHTYTLPFDASTCSIILVTYAQKGVIKIEKTYENSVADSGMIIDGAKVIITLTQEETQALEPGFALSQVRVLTNGGQSLVSDIFKSKVNNVLNDEILGE